MSETLAERVAVLRDEVLDTASQDGQPRHGGELFDAIVRALSAGQWSSRGDHNLQEAIAERLAWGEPESAVLADLSRVSRRLIAASRRALRDPRESMIVAQISAHVACAAVRLVAIAVVGRAGRERAGLIREELAKTRLLQALDRQREELVRLNAKNP